MNDTINDILEQIKPGECYPKRVTVTETQSDCIDKVLFQLESTPVGMTCNVTILEKSGLVIVKQFADTDNETFTRSLKEDLYKAIEERQAQVIIEQLTPLAWRIPNAEHEKAN